MNARKKDVMETYAVRQEVLSPREFTHLVSKDRGNIRSMEIEPARLGQAGFGGVRVQYRNTVYKPLPAK